MPRFIIKHINRRDEPVYVPQEKTDNVNVDYIAEQMESENPKNKTQKKKDMKQSSITNIENLVSQMSPDQTTKRIKKDKGLIERMESEKIMITEDNRQLLND